MYLLIIFRKTFLVCFLIAGCSLLGAAQTWSELAISEPSYEEGFRFYGYSVDIDGDYAVVGDYRNRYHTGRAEILHHDGERWLSIGVLSASDSSKNDYFGYSVSISGKVVVVGAKHDNTNNGAVYVYTIPDTAWSSITEIAKLTASDGAVGDEFGFSVSINQDNVIVGAPNDDDSGVESGSAYVFTKPVSGWVSSPETAKLTASNGAASALFGSSVDIDGDEIAIGSIGYSNSKGAGYIFTKPIGAWASANETAILTASDIMDNYQFGVSVSISGNNVVFGAEFASDFKGAAYVFTKTGMSWVSANETAKLTSSDASVGDRFGTSVCIDSNTIVVGAFWDDEGFTNSGSAYVFEKTGNNWVSTTETAKLSAINANTNEFFGKSVSISKDKMIVGAYNYRGIGTITGAIYAFSKNGGGWSVNEDHEIVMPIFDTLNYSSLTAINLNYSYKIDVEGDYTGIIGTQGIYVNYYDGLRWLTQAIFRPTTVTGSSRNFTMYQEYLVICSWAGSGASTLGGINGVKAFVYKRNGKHWKSSDTPIATLYTSQNSSFGFGKSIDMDGDNIVIGSDEGVFVYHKTGQEWTSSAESAKLTPSSGPTSNFARSVAIVGDKIVAGQVGYGTNVEAAAYLYVSNDSTWTDTTESAILKPSNSNSIIFGHSIDIQNGDVIVGAPGDTGTIYLYDQPTSSVTPITETAILTSTDHGQLFGYRIDASNDYVVVGAPGDDEMGTDAGAVYYFRKPENGWVNMTQTGKLFASNPQAGIRFGYDVSLSGDYMGVVARENVNFNAESAAYLYGAGCTTPSGLYQDTICYGGSLQYNGIVYDSTNLTGQEHYVVGVDSCDSIVNVMIHMLPELSSDTTAKLCGNDTIYINGTAYHAGNSTGVEVFNNIGQYGCDSSVYVNLTFTTSISDFSLNPIDTSSCDNVAIISEIKTSGSQVDIRYSLRNDLNDTLVDSSIIGDGSILSFNTGLVESSSTYNVLAESRSSGLYFDGVNDYLVTENDILNAPPSNLTLELWVKSNLDVSTGYRWVYSMEGYYNCKINGAGDVMFFFDGTQAGASIAAGVMSDNKWHHLVGTNDGTTTRVYIDGVFSNSHAEIIGDITNTNRPTGIGAVYNGTNPFKGSIDEVRLWTITRSEAQIQENIESCLSSSESGIYTYYNFENTGDNDTVQDLSSNSNHLAFMNTDYPSSVTSGAYACSKCSITLSDLPSVNILPVLSSVDSSTLCAGDSIVINGTTYNSSNLTGSEVFNNIGIYGCDSTVTIELTMLSELTGVYNEVICSGESVTINGTEYNAANSSGLEVFKNIGDYGCDSTVTVSLNVLPEKASTIDTTLCADGSLTINGQIYDLNNSSGTEVFTNIGAFGCDSIVDINITFLEENITTIDSIIQAGDEIVVGNSTYSLTGNYTDTLIDVQNCDSIIITNLSVINGIDRISYEEVIIWPNPTSGYIYVTLSSPTENLTTNIYNAQGVLLKQMELTGLKENKINLNFPAGMFFVEIMKQGELKGRTKVVKK